MTEIRAHSRKENNSEKNTISIPFLLYILAKIPKENKFLLDVKLWVF